MGCSTAYVGVWSWVYIVDRMQLRAVEFVVRMHARRCACAPFWFGACARRCVCAPFWLRCVCAPERLRAFLFRCACAPLRVQRTGAQVRRFGNYGCVPVRLRTVSFVWASGGVLSGLCHCHIHHHHQYHLAVAVFSGMPASASAAHTHAAWNQDG